MADRTPSQTIGPFFHEALRWPQGAHVQLAEQGKGIALCSAARRRSVIVADSPRFRRTGRPHLPTSSSSEKFCMLRAPICRQSANSHASPTRRGCAARSCRRIFRRRRG